jgi:hypothetical protein
VPWFDYRIQFADVFAAGGFDLVMCGLASNAPRESDPLEIEGEPFVTTPGDHAVELPREFETLAASEVT